MVYTIVLTAIVRYLPVLSCLAQAPVLVAASLFSCTLLCAQVPVGLSWQPPSLGLCGLSSRLFCLSLGLASCLAGLVSAVAASASRRFYVLTNCPLKCSALFLFILFNKAAVVPASESSLFPDTHIINTSLHTGFFPQHLNRLI